MYAPWDVENPPLIVLVYAPCEIEKCSFISTFHGTWKMLLLKAWEIECTPFDVSSMGHRKCSFEGISWEIQKVLRFNRQ
jgi:hypothetical protein